MDLGTKVSGDVAIFPRVDSRSECLSNAAPFPTLIHFVGVPC